jgi:DNA-binding beta-propeller fold protein YncE
VANGGDGSVRVYDGSSYRLLKTVHLASDADDTRYDVARNRVWVGYGDEGSAGLGILDGTTGELVGTVPLPGHPESFQLEPGGPLIFVNIPTAGNIIAVVNRDQRRVVATWRLGEARENFPMALDAPGRRLYVTCRTPAQMLVLDTDTGKILDRLAVSGDADDMWYDAARRRIYISAGQGTIAVVRVDPSGGYSLEAEVPTAPGGRTSFFAPQLDRLFLGVWGRGGRPAELRAYAPMP